MKQILIINGSAGVGKDTFVDQLSKITTVYHTSIINPVKEIAKRIGWTGEKTEKDRKFLCDLKLLIDTYNDSNYDKMRKIMNEFLDGKIDAKILCIDMRDGMQIIRAKEEFGAKAVLVTRDSVEHITSNSADAGVFDIEYDYHIENNGTIKDLFDKAKEFLSKTNVPKYKKVVYISHPFEGKCENLNDIQEIVFNLIKEHPDHLFLSPVHCFGFEYSMLDYNQGLNECLWLLAKSDEMWVFGDYKNSKGCLAEIEFCKNHAIKYQIFDEKRGS